jgi:uncharacterized SAM-binding protein YcdF (DUF218 family)
LWAWFVLALILCVGGAFLWRSGRWLVRDDAFSHVKWALVLAGESRDCERSDAALRLFQEGRIDTIIESGCRIFKNRYESEFAVDYLVQKGVPQDRLFEFRQDAYSTLEEARLLVRQFRLQNLDTVLVITSSFHTARTRRIFRKLAQGYPVVLVSAAEYHVYDPNAWWSNRESRKLWFNEWCKTLFTYYELWRAKPETGKAEYQGLTPDPWSNGPGPALPSSVPVDTARAGTDSASAKAVPGEGKEPSREPGADSAKAAADTVKARKDSVRSASGTDREAAGKAVEAKAKEEVRAAEAKAAEVKSARDSAAAAEAAAKANEAAKFAAEATRSAVESKDGKAAKDTVAKKSLPRAPKKPAAPAPKPAPKHEEKKAEKAEKAEKTKKKG